MALSKIFEKGMRFECQGTGRCCMSRGTYGYVYLSLSDRKRMANSLGLGLSEFTRGYCDKTSGLFHLKNPEKDCQFLEGTRCAAYEGRPTQCRTWPFWPENMNARTWNSDVAPFCAGVGKGKLHTPEEIQKILDEAKAGDPSRPEVVP
jgi:Fe-S-cluster containining protein